MGTLQNVPLSDFFKFLKYQGWNYARTTGGHEIWKKAGAIRPLVIQTHVDPVPIHVLKNNLQTMGIISQELIDFLK